MQRMLPSVLTVAGLVFLGCQREPASPTGYDLETIAAGADLYLAERGSSSCPSLALLVREELLWPTHWRWANRVRIECVGADVVVSVETEAGQRVACGESTRSRCPEVRRRRLRSADEEQAP